MNRRGFLGAILAAACPPLPAIELVEAALPLSTYGFVPWHVWFRATNLNEQWMARLAAAVPGFDAFDYFETPLLEEDRCKDVAF